MPFVRVTTGGVVQRTRCCLISYTAVSWTQVLPFDSCHLQPRGSPAHSVRQAKSSNQTSTLVSHCWGIYACSLILNCLPTTYFKSGTGNPGDEIVGGACRCKSSLRAAFSAPARHSLGRGIFRFVNNRKTRIGWVHSPCQPGLRASCCLLCVHPSCSAWRWCFLRLRWSARGQGAAITPLPPPTPMAAERSLRYQPAMR